MHGAMALGIIMLAGHGRMDHPTGEFIDLGRIQVTAEAVKEFAAAYDPQPQHIDERAAAQTLLGGLVASGWQMCAVLMRQVERQLEAMFPQIGVPSIDEIRWLKPVRPGDALDARFGWRSRCSCRACGDAGGRAIVAEVVDRTGDPILRMNGNVLLPPREASPAGVWQSAIRCAEHVRRRPRVPRRRGGHLVRYFEEVELGDEIELGSFDFTPTAMASYSRMIQSVCGDSNSPSPSPATLRGHVVSGWHVVSAWMRKVIDYYQAEADWLAKHSRPVPLLGPAAGARSLSWCKPVRAGETIAFSSWAEHKIEIGTSSDWGLLVAGAEGVNQDGEIVVSFYPLFLLQKKTA